MIPTPSKSGKNATGRHAYSLDPTYTMTTSPPDLIETMHADDAGLIDLMPEHLARLAHSAGTLGYSYPGDFAVMRAVQTTRPAHSLVIRRSSGQRVGHV